MGFDLIGGTQPSLTETQQPPVVQQTPQQNAQTVDDDDDFEFGDFAMPKADLKTFKAYEDLQVSIDF